MITIPHEVSCFALTEGTVHSFTAEASTLGLPVGKWPAAFSFADMIGNGQPFYRTGYHVNPVDRDLLAVDYKQHLGCLTLRIYND